ncbi:structure-specific endonuclease subunit SLX1 [Carica papaya]|uniref:structure-specific endonuclease subunit SLX1 n=1 Tax=Carica papaya TaxID=3649 RepID=UPI000B8CD682|nr:structure-specific endonuclease subunit SLX1 [Carica papaya]XP_021887409.1 structure-specific endonuclease subunit SLX1 [Carica papaya]
MMMTRQLSKTFHQRKHLNPNPQKSSPLPPQPSSSSTLKISEAKSHDCSTSKSRSWCVYLILSTNKPIKTYVGVTTDFGRRLKQHNGEIKGGAKASRAGRPWICACIIHGFSCQNDACQFESKWKSFSRKLARKRINKEATTEMDDGSLPLLQHRQTALNKVLKGLLDCTRLTVDWQMKLV